MIYLGWFLFGLLLGVLIGGITVLIIFDLDQDVEV